MHLIELFKNQLEKVKTLHKGNKPRSVHVLGDFNFRDIVWPDRLNKQGFSLSMSEGAKLVQLISDHELEQVVHFPTRGQNTLDLIITSLPGQLVDIHSPDRLSDHDIVSGTLKTVKLLKDLNPSKALGPDELHPRVLKELASELGPVFALSFNSQYRLG